MLSGPFAGHAARRVRSRRGGGVWLDSSTFGTNTRYETHVYVVHPALLRGSGRIAPLFCCISPTLFLDSVALWGNKGLAPTPPVEAQVL